MTTLEGLLRGIIENPQTEDRWLVLADWLEENDDPRRAELLRLHRQLLATCCKPERHSKRAMWQARMVDLLHQGIRPCMPRKMTLTAGSSPRAMARRIVKGWSPSSPATS